MDTTASESTEPNVAQDDESFLDEVYARIVDLIGDARRPDPAILAEGRGHLLPRIRHLVLLARTVSPLQEIRRPVLPGYEVLARLGAGGMGEVFLCRQTKMGGRLVAVKVLSEAFAASGRGLDMLRDEALALARLRHPGVVDVYEFIEGRDNDQTIHAFAMQWIQGCSLAQWFARLEASRPAERTGRAASAGGSSPPTAATALRPPRLGSSHAPAAGSSTPSLALPYPTIGDRAPRGFACRVLASVAQTVDVVHREGLLHRDLKPSNILLREDGSALVSDFGLARDIRAWAGSEAAGGFSGTRAFASPEQCRGEPLDARSDIYSLGMTLRHVLFEPPPADLGAIIARATAPEPGHRYATAAEFAADIERFLARRPVRANPPSVARRCAMFLGRNRRAVLSTTVGALFTLLIAGAIVTAVFIAPRRAESHLARARIELLSPGHANVIWNTEWYRLRGDTFELGSDARTRAADAYGAALRWRPWGHWSDGVRRELAVVEAGGVADPSGDPRLSGLAAYLAGDSNGAIAAWSGLAAREDPGAFIDGALGVLYLVREQHALAYPRLELARSAFPEVGFLAVYHADAAIGCGDLDRAERLLSEAARLDNHDNHRALLRVWSDLHLARGKTDQAEELLLRATLTRFDPDKPVPPEELEQARIDALVSPIAGTRLARIRAARGEYDSAASALGSVLARGMGPPAARAEFTRYVDRWWDVLSVRARRDALRRSMDMDPGDPASLIFRLRHSGASESVEGMGSGQAGREAWRQPVPSPRLAFWNDFVALAGPDSHSSLERASRDEITRRLEVWNWERWNTIRKYSDAMKSWQLVVWQLPLPCVGSEIIERLHRARPRPAGRGSDAAGGSASSALK